MKNAELLEKYYMYYDQQGQLVRKPKVDGLRIIYNVNKNINALPALVKELLPDVMVAKKPEYLAYEAEMKSLYAKVSEGKTKEVNGQQMYDLEGKEAEFQKEALKINKKHEASLTERNKQIKEYQEFLEKDFEGELKWYTFTLDELEERNADIKGEDYDLIEWMIKEDTAS